MKRLKMVVLGMMFAVGMVGMVMAGNIDSPGAPSAGSGMYTLKQIYDYLSAGTAATKQASFQGPTAGPAGTGYTLKDVYAAVATPFPQCDAAVSNVYSGKKFFCTVSGSWGVKTGTLAPQVYCTLLKTGQTSVYYTGDDASKGKGKAFSYTDSSSNSVTDNVTGLMWAKDGSGAGGNGGAAMAWTRMLTWVVSLTFDGYSDWRLPNVTELQSILVRDAAHGSPYINTTYFTNTKTGYPYWTSNTDTGTATAVVVYFTTSAVNGAAKTNAYQYARAVRGGE